MRCPAFCGFEEKWDTLGDHFSSLEQRKAREMPRASPRRGYVEKRPLASANSSTYVRPSQLSSSTLHLHLHWPEHGQAGLGRTESVLHEVDLPSDDSL